MARTCHYDSPSPPAAITASHERSWSQGGGIVIAWRSSWTPGVRSRTSAPPHTLSPSSMSTFTSCPLAFRFSYIERLPEAAVGAREQGHPRPPGPAAPDVAAGRPSARSTTRSSTSPGPRRELAADPEFAAARPHRRGVGRVPRRRRGARPPLLRDGGSRARSRCSASSCASRAETADGVVIRGIIDRLELDADGELVVTDYKTGREPGEGWEQQSMAGRPHLLAAVRADVRPPARSACSCCTSRSRSGSSPQPSDQSLRGVEVKSGAVMKAVRTACARADFRPRASALCAYCSFREFCPEYGGDPGAGRAGDARAPGRPRRPAAAPARHRLSLDGELVRHRASTPRSTAPSIAAQSRARRRRLPPVERGRPRPPVVLASVCCAS